MTNYLDAQLILYRAHLQLEQGQHESVFEILQDCVSQDDKQQQEVTYLSGWAYVLGKQWGEAERMLSPMLDAQTQELGRTIQLERERIAFFLFVLGLAANHLAFYEDASLHFSTCLNVLHVRRIHLPKVRMQARYSLGMANLLKGQPQAALQSFTETLKLCQHYQETEMPARVYHGLCEAYQAISAHEQAYEAGQTSLLLYQQHSDHQQSASLHQALGQICFHLEKYREAREHYTQALQVAQEIQDLLLLTANHALLAELCLAERRLEEARHYSQLAMAHVEQLGNPAMQSKVYVAMGKVSCEEAMHMESEAQKSLLETTVTYFKQALEGLKRIQAHQEMANLYSLLAQTLEMLGREEEALLCWRSGFKVLQE